MPLERSTRNRILRIMFFASAWSCMAFMLVALVALAGLTHLFSRKWDLELPLGSLLLSHIVFLCLFGLLVLTALVKEPFIVSDHISLVVNSVLLLVAAWLFAVSVLAFIVVFQDTGFTLGG